MKLFIIIVEQNSIKPKRVFIMPYKTWLFVKRPEKIFALTLTRFSVIVMINLFKNKTSLTEGKSVEPHASDLAMSVSCGSSCPEPQLKIA